MASLGIQVHGGMGFIEETGAAQYYRDARIAPIYEGTNGIQAIDLVTRKLPIRQGGAVVDLLDQIEATIGSAADDLDDLADLAEELKTALTALRRASAHLLKALVEDPNQALSGATPYLRMFGLVLGGWFHLRSAIAATNGPDTEFGRGRIGRARFYCPQLLAAAALLPAVTAPLSDLAPSNL
jgi:hypothetical protein